MPPRNKLILTSSANLAREEEQISKKGMPELFDYRVLGKLEAGKAFVFKVIYKYLLMKFTIF